MHKRALFFALLLLTLIGSVMATRAFAQGPAFLVADIRVPLSSDVKFPHVDTLDRTVYVSGNAERSYARLWTKQDNAGSFPNPALMGTAEGTPNYSSTAVFTAPDGTVHYAWINEANRRVFLRSKAPGAADFGPERLVSGSSPGPVEVEVAANEDGVFVFWRESEQPLKFRHSPDGVSWNVPVQSLGTIKAWPNIDIAAGAGRRLAVAYTRGRGDYLQGYLALWSNGAFIIERIPTVEDRSFADPSVTFLPDGTIAAAIRSPENEDGLGAGVYVTDRAPNGVWSAVGRLIKGGTSFLNIDADPLGNIHLGWINAPSGNDIWYIARRAGTPYSGAPLTVDSGALPLFNVRAAASLSDRGYGHFVTERFSGRVPFMNYYVFGLPVSTVKAQAIAIEAGAATTRKPTVSVAFSGVEGTPTEVRWNWDAPPTDSASASGGYKPFNNPLSVAGPAGVSPATCTSATLYTQLKAAALVQTTANSDTIVFDRGVQSAFTLSNPLAGYAPGYTNQPTATLTVENGAECSGLAAATVSGPTTGGSLALSVAGKARLTQNIPLTGGQGAKTLTISATDTLGNLTSVPRTIIYDTTPPVFADGGSVVEPAPRPRGSVIVDLTLTNITASDDRQLYGILVTPTGSFSDENGTSMAIGSPILIPFSTMSQFRTDPGTGKLSLRTGVNLTRGFPAEVLAPGLYSFEIVVVDAAGNPSAASTTRAVQIDAISYAANLPLTRKR